MPKDEEPLVREDNKALVEHAFGEVLGFLEKRGRKRKKEAELYRIANKSEYGWKTSEAYDGDDTFKDSSDEDSEFWLKPDLKADKKQEKMHKAESAVKFQNQIKATLAKASGSGNSRGGFRGKSSYRGGKSGGYPRSDGNFRSDGGWQNNNSSGKGFVPFKDRTCHKCHEVGHIAPQCPKGGSKFPRGAGSKN